MFGNKLVLPGTLLLALFLFGLPTLAVSKDLSTVQTALRIAQDEVKAAEAERDADAKRVAVTEKEMERLKKQLEAERSTAENIKSKQTRSVVTDAIDMIIRTLKGTKRTPPNGLALYAGNVSEKEGISDIKLWAIEPPKPIKTRLYRCDQTFVLDPLKEQLEYTDFYALIVLDKKEATIGLLKGTNITVLAHMTSGVPGKQKAGGQSSTRFARLREEAAHEFYKRIAEISNKTFLEMKKLTG